MLLSGIGAEAYANNVAVIVSRNIRPYLEAMEGLKSAFLAEGKTELRFFFLEDYQDKSSDLLVNEMGENKFPTVVSVGPEAARFVQHQFKSMARWHIYTMILNPEEVLPEEKPLCGVSLRIPFKQQVELLNGLFTAGARIGLLFDPKNNESFFKLSQAEADKNGLQLLPIRVTSPKEIPQLLKEAWPKIDYLWFIPDQTVSRESLVQYIIKEAMANRVGCIGYNRFFVESGAAVSLVMDYREIGRQTGELVQRLSAGKDCSPVPPAYNTEVNHQLLKMLGLKLRTMPEAGGGKP